VEFQRTYAYAYRLYGTDVVSDRAGLRITYNRDGSLSRIDLAVPRPVTETVEDPVPVAEAATRLACDFARRPACMVRGERIGLDSAVVDSVWFGYRWEVRGGVDCLVPALKYRSRNYLHNGTEVLLRGDVSLDDASRMSENRGPPMGNRP